MDFQAEKINVPFFECFAEKLIQQANFSFSHKR